MKKGDLAKAVCSVCGNPDIIGMYTFRHADYGIAVPVCSHECLQKWLTMFMKHEKNEQPKPH